MIIDTIIVGGDHHRCLDSGQNLKKKMQQNKPLYPSSSLWVSFTVWWESDRTQYRSGCNFLIRHVDKNVLYKELLLNIISSLIFGLFNVLIPQVPLDIEFLQKKSINRVLVVNSLFFLST